MRGNEHRLELLKRISERLKDDLREKVRHDPDAASVYSQDKSSFEQLTRELQHRKSSLELNHLELFGKMRGKGATFVYVYLIVYSVFSAFVIGLQGFRIKQFVLPETALDILIGSTAVSAISLVATVLKGLFPTNPKKSFKR
ncbi:hypothetical protein N5W20_05320 [Candidatus Kirkpatrickella diaphorinae]|uniref:Uncharacterized protein n=1 Tax=Candidatus Kirkpatrickella diaphorinae TaxID=2984322 RepID=A0ABY6GIE7_9PROT|nr:hypothetical protein [Candidatus Kirkpatrickella diaphorinae]UYH50548.1 hypothetical protein N5W20_05320 [Candidatus Kirkpatrickella diaphorinae]